MQLRRRDLGVVLVAVGLYSACHDPDKYSLLSPSNPNGTAPSALLDVVPAASSIPANGGTRTRIEARIDPASSVRTVTFETTAGTLYAGSSNSKTSPKLEVQVDGSGVGAAELQSSTDPGTARVTVSIALPKTTPPQNLARSVDITFTPVNVGQMLTVVATPSTADADGASLVRIVATLATEIPREGRTVKFTTTAGSFATNRVNGNDKEASVMADAGHVASVDLVAPFAATPATITVTASDFSAWTTVTFSPALPDTVFVELSAGSVMAALADTVSVTVKLMRNVGRVADNTVVTFSATDAGGNRIGGFEKVMLGRVDTSGSASNPPQVIATADFNPDNTAALGVATITATVGSRTGSATITVN